MELAGADPAALGIAPRRIARDEHHQQDRGDEVGDQQQRHQWRRDQRAGVRAALEHGDGAEQHDDQGKRRAKLGKAVKATALPLARKPADGRA